MANRILPVVICILSLTVSIAAEDRFFNSDGVQIRYVEEGTGSPVFLLHGFSGNVERNWSSLGVIENLRKDFRVVAFDSRGNGKSGKPHDPSAYGNQMARDVVRLMDHLKIAKAHMVGYSMGASVVAKLLVTSPERFLTATLGGYGGRRAPEDPKAIDQEADVLVDALGLSDTSDVRPVASADDELRATAQRIKAEGGDLRALAAMVRARPDLWVSDAQMAKVRVPTLAIIGSLDPRLKELEGLRTVFPSMKVVVIEGTIHAGGAPNGTVRHPQFISALRMWLTEHRSAR